MFWQYEKFENSIKLFCCCFFQIGTFEDIFEFKYHFHLLMGIIDMTGLNQIPGCDCSLQCLLWVWDEFGKNLGGLWEDSGTTLEKIPQTKMLIMDSPCLDRGILSQLVKANSHIA